MGRVFILGAISLRGSPPGLRKLSCARTVPKPYSFVLLGLALSEKQNPQVIEKIEKPKEQIEGLESSVVLRRQTLFPLKSGRNSIVGRQFLITNGQQPLGVALPWAIAATLVRPQEKVLSISGDSGFLFSANELETAVRLKSHLVHIIWIDGTYDMVATQERIKYNRTSGGDFGPVDSVKYAEAFGATGLRIDQPDQIAATLRKAFDTASPVLVGVHVDYRQNAKLFEQVYEGSIL